MTASSKSFSAADVQNASRSMTPAQLASSSRAMENHLNVLERIVVEVGEVPRLESFGRSPEHNLSVGGVPGSDHLLGHASDPVFARLGNEKVFHLLKSKVRALGIDQLIYDPTDKSLHVGTGPRQRAQAWIEASPPKVIPPALRPMFDLMPEGARLAATASGALALLLALVLVLTSRSGRD